MTTSNWSVTTSFVFGFRDLPSVPSQPVAITALPLEERYDLEPPPEGQAAFRFSASLPEGQGLNAYMRLIDQVWGPALRRAPEWSRISYRPDLVRQVQEFVEEARVPVFGSPPETWMALADAVLDPGARTVAVQTAAGTSIGLITVGGAKAIYTRVGAPMLDVLGNRLTQLFDTYLAMRQEDILEQLQRKRELRQRKLEDERRKLERDQRLRGRRPGGPTLPGPSL